MQFGDVDKICLRDYVVGMGWALLSLCGMFIAIDFENLPFALLISHAEGVGEGQVVIGIVCLCSFIASLGYLLQTYNYQKYLGK